MKIDLSFGFLAMKTFVLRFVAFGDARQRLTTVQAALFRLEQYAKKSLESR
jgi:hypothetical protein